MPGVYALTAAAPPPPTSRGGSAGVLHMAGCGLLDTPATRPPFRLSTPHSATSSGGPPHDPGVQGLDVHMHIPLEGVGDKVSGYEGTLGPVEDVRGGVGETNYSVHCMHATLTR